MEANKEEALRARAIAEKKLQEKDYVGARKFALKAQQLYPGTENIGQMICVCDVHCSAQKNLLGNDLDWYSILQIEITAEEMLIKKQYRKFALLLHPDKNKFAGAEAAFKLIGEAQRILLDKNKRSAYDLKRKASRLVVPCQAPPQASRNFNVAKPSVPQNSFTSNYGSHVKNPAYQEPKQQAQPNVVNGKQTFWTLCPYCAVRYQFYIDVLKKQLKCQSCNKPFAAFDMENPRGQPTTQPVFPQSNNNVGSSKTAPQSVSQKRASMQVPQAAANAKFMSESSKQGASVSEKPASTQVPQPAPCGKFMSEGFKQGAMGANQVSKEGEMGSKASQKVNGKRGKKQIVESSESLVSESSLDSVEMLSDGDTPGVPQFDSTRKSRRNKRHVSYNENASDDEDIMSASKRPKESGQSSSSTEKKAEVKVEGQPGKVSDSAFVTETKRTMQEVDGNKVTVESVDESTGADDSKNLESDSETTPEPVFYDYPDPEFSDFDKEREQEHFKVGQVWAAFDTADAMPRFYARIRRITTPGFKLRITWLEPDPDDEVGKEWANCDLPYSCGKFKNGDSENTEDRLMFSHVISWEKGSGRDSTKIYPRKGETWAVFKNWDANWYKFVVHERKFEYEFVEILSDYDDVNGIRVVLLGKLKGFASLFCRKGENILQIRPAEILKFSHRVPSHRMTGHERRDVPRDSFELDPASISTNLEEIDLPKFDGLSSKSADPINLAEVTGTPVSSSHANGKSNQFKHGNHVDPDINGDKVHVPDPDFFNFDELKSVDQFQANQVWALYSDVDGLPKYYGLVKKVIRDPLEVFINWLEPTSSAANMELWTDEKMPISCGLFKAKARKSQRFTDISSFSHQVLAGTSGKNVFAVYPRVGEVWALYRNWKHDMSSSVLDKCEYEYVEVIGDSSSLFKVMVLVRVLGFTSVFKPLEVGNSKVIREIPRFEVLRFSHLMPSFRLTGERGGSQRGNWELDPAAFVAPTL